jgi:protein O-GlcNAc transferase
MAEHDMRDRLDKIVGLLTRGEATAAEKEAQRCVRLFAQAPEPWFLLGAAQHMQRRHAEALAAFDRTLALSPTHMQALQARAAVLYETARWPEMLSACEQAVALYPGNVSITANLGTALEKLDRLDEALQKFDEALAIDPNHLNALLNRGALLLRLQRLDEALANNRRLVASHPAFADGHYNLADVLLSLHQYAEALAASEAGLAVAPRHARLQLKRAVALASLGRFAEAQAALAEAQILEPGLLAELLPDIARLPASVDPYANAELIYLEAGIKAQYDCNWQRRDEFLASLTDFIATQPPSSIALHEQKLALPLLSMPLNPKLRLKAMRQISEYVQDSAWLYGLPPFRHAPRQRDRIRIGYVSPDFRDHSVGHLSRPLYRLHDRSRFEIHCYSLVRDDEDPVQREIAGSCDHWHDVSPLSAAAIAQQIYADSIDILIDLAGYTKDARPEMFALRPAPVQAHYLGYPGTMGAEFIDYAIADAVVCPAGEEHLVAEKLIRLPGAYSPYDPATPHASTTLTRSDFGLPEDGLVFCCFSASYKIEPTTFGIWLELLRQVPDSVLWLVPMQAHDLANLRHEAERADIAGERLIAASRLERGQHLQRFQLADLFLDTRWHNAHTMAADALWQGLPVLTCAGPHWSSRLAASLLHAVGMPELITHTLEEYAALALRLANDREQLAALHNKLMDAHAGAPLFAPETTVRHLEDAYQAMWDACCVRNRPQM